MVAVDVKKEEGIPYILHLSAPASCVAYLLTNVARTKDIASRFGGHVLAEDEFEENHNGTKHKVYVLMFSFTDAVMVKAFKAEAGI